MPCPALAVGIRDKRQKELENPSSEKDALNILPNLLRPQTVLICMKEGK